MHALARLISDTPFHGLGVGECTGAVTYASKFELRATLPQANIGDVCLIKARNSIFKAEVVGFDNSGIRLTAYSALTGISPGAEIKNTGEMLRIGFSDQLLGKVINGFGQIISGHEKVSSDLLLTASNSPPKALERSPICIPFKTGIRAIDALCTIGIGQRIGLMASAGVGKSTLLGMIARNADADINIIALVGERGREVNEFIDECLGENGLSRSIVVVSTSDEAPIIRSIALQTATSIAEHYRSRGKKVLLLVDSLTRTARAMRDVALSAGELPIRQGFPASVFSQLPNLVERAGNNSKGSITAIYTVLTNGRDESDPLSEEIKSLLDGHLVLDPDIMAQGIRPAINIPASVSRVFPRLHSVRYQQHVDKIRNGLARLARERDLLLFGGTPDEHLSKILRSENSLRGFLNQGRSEVSEYSDSLQNLEKIYQEFYST